MPLYMIVAEKLMAAFGNTGNLGLVAGATFPEQLGAIRKLVGPQTPLLIPGIGKQGGDLEATLRANDNGLCIINSSRGIIYASSGKDFTDKASQAASQLYYKINETQRTISGSGEPKK